MKSQRNKKQIILLVTIISLIALTVFEILLARYIDLNNPEINIGNLIRIHTIKHYYTYNYKPITGEKYETNQKTGLISSVIIMSLIQIYNIIRYKHVKSRGSIIVKYFDTLSIGMLLQVSIAHHYQMLRYDYVTDYIKFGNQIWIYDIPDLMYYTAILLIIVIPILRIHYSFKEDKLII